MNTISKLAVLATLALSSTSFAHDCRAIFEPGFSAEAQALIGKKFVLVDEDKIEDIRVIPFRISVKEDLDLDPETLTLTLTFKNQLMIEEKHDSIGFHENVALTRKWLKSLPSCAELYKPRH